jgi:hypothetical protein
MTSASIHVFRRPTMIVYGSKEIKKKHFLNLINHKPNSRRTCKTVESNKALAVTTMKIEEAKTEIKSALDTEGITYTKPLYFWIQFF